MERMVSKKLDAQIAKMIARCLYEDIFIYDVEFKGNEINLKFKEIHKH